MRMRFVVLAALATLLPLSAAAQGGDPGRRIDAARRQAEQAGIPVALLESKVAEGRAKGVPMDRIAVAVERRLGALSRAREVMATPGGARVSPDALRVGADALEAGVDPEVLRSLNASAPAAHRAVAIAVLTQLVRDGEASDRALARVTQALARGPDALRNLPGQSGQARGRGADPPGRGNGAAGQGNGRGRGNAGPPASVPVPGQKPGGGRPANPGGGNGGGNGNQP